MTIGTEHEYSINNSNYTALPISDKIIKSICGTIQSDIPFGTITLGKELQKTVLEIIPNRPSSNLLILEKQLVQGINKFYKKFPTQYKLLGLGMHPTLTLDKTSVWNHNEKEIYKEYDRLFNIHQHGWLNIQALQINFSYYNDHQLITNYNKIRLLLPYLIAITTSSPIVENKFTGIMDNRLIYYRENQKEVPQICNQIIPENLNNISNYHKLQNEIFSELKSRGADILCKEWLNSSGLIIRFSRKCLEIKALDEQECIHSDLAVCAFIQSLLRSPLLYLPKSQEDLLSLTNCAIQHGTLQLKPELLKLYKIAWNHATPKERIYLPVILFRIKNGSLAELIHYRYNKEGNIIPILQDMALALRTNSPYNFN